MAHEVIDLLSSSPPPGPSRETSQLSPPLPNPRKRLSGDVFDDITNRVSNGTSHSRRPDKRACVPQSRDPPAPDNLHFGSSDSSDLADFLERPKTKNANAAAGRFLSRDDRLDVSKPGTGNEPGRGTRLLNGPDAATRLKRAPSSDDPIELTSTPVPATQAEREWVQSSPGVFVEESFTFSPTPELKSSPRNSSTRAITPEATRHPHQATTVPQSGANWAFPLDTPSPIRDLSSPRITRNTESPVVESRPIHRTKVQPQEKTRTPSLLDTPSPVSHLSPPRKNHGRPSSKVESFEASRRPLHRTTSHPQKTTVAAYPLDTPSPPSSWRPPKRRKEWDPISSSAPEQQRKPDIVDLGSESEDDALSISSDDSLPDVANIRPSWLAYDGGKTKPARKKTVTSASSKGTSKTTTKATSRSASDTAPPRKTTEERTREKELREAAREAEKAKKKEERDEARAKKAKEKELAAALAEANKARTDKKISGREMIVDLPSTLDDAVTLQAQTLLQDLGIEHTSWLSPVSKVVKWRRKVRSRYNEELDHYEPIPERVEKESFALAIMTADEFVDAALAVDGRDLNRHVRMMKLHFSDHTLMYLIEGLEPWMRRNRNLRNRQFSAAVRGAGDAQPPSRRRGAPARTEYVDEDAVEDHLLALQVRHGALIHHTAVGIETAQWIATFTQHISTVPYRRKRDEVSALSAGFCMDSGQVRSGVDKADTYTRMLQEISRVTLPIAYGIAAEFDTVSKLVNRLETRGPLALEDCKKGINRDGDLSEARIGPTLSKKLHKVFTGVDDTSTDV